jgi:hypothetical protein
MNVFENAISIEFPLRGEWMSPNTPGSKIPSHGSDMLGQTYAFDFLQVNWDKKGMHFYDASLLRYLLFGVPLKKNYCWGQNIHAPCDGKIIKCEDGLKERKITHLVSDLCVVLKNAFFGNLNKLHPILGNYIIMECNNNVFAGFAHLQNGSINVSEGEIIKKGQILGKIGHSGNSTGAHLHFQLMDNSNILEAKGIPCVLEKFEVYNNESKIWETRKNSIPKNSERFRYNGI